MAAAKAPPSPVALIMAGGSGTRFWPLSKKNKPKQYLNLIGEKSLIQQTAERIAPLVGDRISVVSTKEQGALLKNQLPDLKSTILEPLARNTAPCLLLSVAELSKQYPPETPLIVLAADHHIGQPENFLATLRQAVSVAIETRGLVTLGIVPHSPHTGYGYIEAGAPAVGGARRVQRFVEKPNRERAEEFLRAKNFFWNSGIFIWTLAAIAESFARYMPEEWEQIRACRTPAEVERAYAGFAATPIDIAILEKADNVFVIPADFAWSDVGSWSALYDLHGGDAQGNVVLSGQVKHANTKGCLVQVDPSRRVALIGVENLIIVESEGTLLISERTSDQLVRTLAKDFEGT